MGTIEEIMSEAGFIKEYDAWVYRKPVAEEVSTTG